MTLIVQNFKRCYYTMQHYNALGTHAAFVKPAFLRAKRSRKYNNVIDKWMQNCRHLSLTYNIFGLITIQSVNDNVGDTVFTL